MNPDNRQLLRELSEERCWELLKQKQVGRLAVSIRNKPDVFPVNYKVAGMVLIVRTSPGLKLAAAVLGASVAFEVDAIDDETETGWSVVIKGTATELESLDDLLYADDLEIKPWAAGSKNRYVQIVPASITGREIPPSAS